ncbi:hypothetical protein [Massilia genomosp. 1]|uniref:Uncharacterized protein n=1 Tax=Massilia genomosp. 1 TaxID=2609280 RepID=A0ABX0MIK3_9BURK|nr:hypothetical protein [Massilia genomosp. 1]NHZ62618.1 hypothetical protein [Massilia genomosp. 1]
MSKKTNVEPLLDTAAPLPAPELVRVRVLALCEHGNCNDVVEIDAALVTELEGVVDADPAAVAYAESLKKA